MPGTIPTVTAITLDVGIVGAGPVGLAAAIAARRHGLVARIWDRGALCASVVDYPVNMVFFTTNDLLEIGDHPLVSGGPKATRREALDYYRKVAEREQLDVVPYTEVTAIARASQGFAVSTRVAVASRTVECRAVIVATGYYSNPRRIDVPGEDLPHVSHYFTEPHVDWHRDVVVVGGGNSACEAALDLYRAGARVTMIVRGAALKPTVKYWVRPDVENRIAEGAIRALFETRVVAISPDGVTVAHGDETATIAAQRVLLLTGFVADAALVRDAGAEVRGDGSVVFDGESFETTVPGLFVIGSAGFGERTGEVFIENGRVHAVRAVEAIARRWRDR